MSTILLIGEDDLLLHTRAAVLRTTGATIVCANALCALPVQEDRQSDLVILCHTISEPLSTSLAETIHVRWPSTQILRVSASRPWDVGPPGAAVDAIASADPELLVQRTTELLSRAAI